MKKFSFTTLFIVLVSFGVSLFLYFYIFNGSLSRNAQDWASFGSYISGILLPILTGLNIWVFIRLTQAIDRENNIRKENDNKRFEERQKVDIEFQRRMIISQIRQTEVNSLSKALDNLFFPSEFCSDSKLFLDSIKVNLVKGQILIDSFVNGRNDLFNINENKEAIDALWELHKKVSFLNRRIDDPSFTVENKLMQEILELKHKAISYLQKYTIDNI
ncbi:MAG: hypothetical protein LLF93_00225 [Bacteroidales bacterium]|nr:hypothetical protein [Bacteroidales bacterium]